MRLLRLTSDTRIRRLRWVMLGVIFFDNLNTLFGQPASYWMHPETVQEGNRLTYVFISRGWAWFAGYEVVYMAAAYLLACVASRRVALTVILSFIFGHYYGASTWLADRWHYGTQGTVVYAIILSGTLAAAIFSPGSRDVTQNKPEEPIQPPVPTRGNGT